jgi:hypothetical protein
MSVLPPCRVLDMNAQISTAVLDQVHPALDTAAAPGDHFLLRPYSLVPPLQRELTVASTLAMARIHSVVVAGPFITTPAAVFDPS